VIVVVYILVAYLIFILLVILLTLSISIGQIFGKIRLKAHPESRLEIDRVAESAVFGLFALLIAFSFSGAYERLENRKMHILTEANAFAAAYDYTKILDTPYDKELQADIKEYLNLHAIAYSQVPYMSKVNVTLEKSIKLENKIWHTAIVACKASPNKNIFLVVMPAIDAMLRTAQTGIYLSTVHPPKIVFILLIGLAITGAFLIGYNAAATNRKRAVHAICYVLLTSFTIYIIINIEYPRAGFIRMHAFDQILVKLKNSM
jgi:hypothetical protein